jgi:hypothetical protein
MCEYCALGICDGRRCQCPMCPRPPECPPPQ